MSTKVSGCMSVLRIPLPLLCVVCSSSNSKMLSVGTMGVGWVAWLGVWRELVTCLALKTLIRALCHLKTNDTMRLWWITHNLLFSCQIYTLISLNNITRSTQHILLYLVHHRSPLSVNKDWCCLAHLQEDSRIRIPYTTIRPITGEEHERGSLH